MWVNGFWTSEEPATHLLFRASRVNGCHVEAQQVKRSKQASERGKEGRKAEEEKRRGRVAGSPALLTPQTLADCWTSASQILEPCNSSAPLQHWRLAATPKIGTFSRAAGKRDFPTSCNYVKPNLV